MNIKRSFLTFFLLSVFSFATRAYAKVDIYLDFAIACNHGTSKLDKVDLRSAVHVAAGRTEAPCICIDKGLVFKNLHVTKLKLFYLKEFDSYILTMYFDPLQLNAFNRFINANINKHSYVIKNNIVVDSESYSTFTSKLVSPELSISVNSKEEGIDLGNELSGHKMKTR